ncbi:MAG: Spy/CpxP family protein refolding chaperone [Acidobacteria bacterium]|nr:Spy/CpxP family protein refolding chaperone [Acidobacteriota bacterium]
MTKSIRPTMVAATVAVMALAPMSLAFAQPGPGGRWHGRQARVERQAGFARGFGIGVALGRLNLTAQQRDAIRAIREGHKTEFDALRQRMRAAGDAMRTAMSAEVVDENAVRAASAQMGEVRTEQAVLQARIRNEVWNLLTPEQKAQANELKAQARARADQRRQRMDERRQRMEQRRQQQPAQKPVQ